MECGFAAHRGGSEAGELGEGDVAHKRQSRLYGVPRNRIASGQVPSAKGNLSPLRALHRMRRVPVWHFRAVPFVSLSLNYLLKT